jgi:hypothetical protein
MDKEQLVKSELEGEPEVFGEHLHHYCIVHQKSHHDALGYNPGRRGEKPVTTRLNYGKAR